MGVDTMTYRARIGTFKHAFGHDVVTHVVFVDLSLLRRIILTELLCSLLLIFALLGNSFVMKLPHEYKNTMDGSILYNCHVPYSLMQSTLLMTLEVIGYTLLLVAVLPDKHSTEAGKYNFNRTDVSKSNVSIGTKLNNLRYMLTCKIISSVFVIGSVIFIGILLLMAGVESNPGPNGGEVHGKEKETDKQSLLRRLGLSEYYPGKIEPFHVISVSNVHNDSLRGRKTDDLPWILLRKLVSLNDTAFCLNEPAEEDLTSAAFCEDSSDEEEGSEVSENINYLDVFLLTYQCCSPKVQQLLIQKMFLCRFAVPFMIRSIHDDNTVISMWPLRALICETDIERMGVCEELVLNMPLKCVAFGRIGRPRFSKSKMLNKLVSDTTSKTFFNVECQSGKFSKSCFGYIETFWLLRVGDTDRDMFDDTIMFLNMRGCLKSDFAEHEMTFVGKCVDVITVFVDKQEYSENMQDLRNIINVFKSVIIVLIERSKVKLKEPEIKIENACQVTYVQTFDKKIKEMKLDNDIKTDIVKHIRLHTKDKKPASFKERFKKYRTRDIITDDQSEACKWGKSQASKFCSTIGLKENFLFLKNEVTPIQSKVAIHLGQLLKELKREKDIATQEETRAKIDTDRDKVLKIMTISIRQFINVLYNAASTERYYFLEWLKFKISNRSRCLLSKLILEYQTTCEYLQRQTNETSGQENETTGQEDVKEQLVQLESQIDAASFSVGHLLREVGLIYDTICELHTDPKEWNIPSVERMASIIGNLTLNGHQLEIIDGDSFYLPQKWLSQIFESIGKQIKVITLSTLGVQSSGKSTLLNTMFGALFATRAGRCTRGIHAQIIPLCRGLDPTTARSEYILILDTEGLRPTEVIYKDHEHDNELATLITGLGDVTIVNVMGENTQEIRDILQIVAHAFIRLKLANSSIDINKCCEIIHQNITSTSAKKHMHDGLMKFIRSLDEMTEDSAKCEGIYDISKFNQVIKFDTSTNVWYISNIWDGNPPFARVNRDYSEKAAQIKFDLFNQFSKMKIITGKTLQDFLVQTNDVWQGVLNENFVFSFKNSLERRAYLHMDEWFQDMLWKIESFVTESTRSFAQEDFSICDTKKEMNCYYVHACSRMTDLIECKRQEAEEHLKSFFENCDNRMIVNQWKENQLGTIQRFFYQLRDIAEDTVRKEKDKHETKLLLHCSDMEHTSALHRKTLDYAKQNPLAIQSMSSEETSKLFEEFWTETVGTHELVKKASCPDMKTLFRKNLSNLHSKHLAVLLSTFKQMHWDEIRLSDSQISLNFEEIAINKADIGSSLHVPFFGKPNWGKFKKHVEMLCKTFNWKIKTICNKNDQILEYHIRELNRYMQEIIKQKKFDVKETFIIKLYVHVSLFAAGIFKKHNEARANLLTLELETYKRQQKLLFEACLNRRRAEDTVAEIITDVIFKYMKEESVAQFSKEILDVLHGRLPSTKRLLIIELCTQYVKERNFSEIYYYIHHPFEAAQQWFEHRANEIVFEGNPCIYSTCNTRIVNTLLLNVVQSVHSLQTINDASISTDSLISRLSSALLINKLFVSTTDLRSVLSGNKVADSELDLQAVCDAVINKLTTFITDLTKSFHACTKDTIWWKKRNPIQNMVETIWGCTAVCPYCHEPCERSINLHPEDHRCVQHRPKCCAGMHYVTSVKASIHTCSYSVQSSNSCHTCSACNYICNDGKTDCKIKSHKYINYRQFFTNWFIPPSSDMHDSSKFWLWFVGTYKDKLANKYGYKLDEIPKSWSSISDQDATESLRTYYK